MIPNRTAHPYKIAKAELFLRTCRYTQNFFSIFYGFHGSQCLGASSEATGMHDCIGSLSMMRLWMMKRRRSDRGILLQDF
jgi:hypothetical protein